MKRPLAYITAAWCGIPEVDTDLAVEFCRAAYEAGLAPICPKLYLPLILNDNVPEEHKDGIDMGRDRMRRIAHVCTTWFESANRCPSFWHRRQTQALKRKTRHVRRFRNVSVPLPVPVPFLCRIYKMPSHQASSFLHQNPQPTARSCCPPALDRSPPHLCTKHHGQSNAP